MHGIKSRCHDCPIAVVNGKHVLDPQDGHAANPRYRKNVKGTTVKMFEYDAGGKCKPA